MNDQTLKLFSKYCLHETSAKDFSDWAIYCLEHGIDSKNIRILASMFTAQYESEVSTYFFKSLDDLNWNYPSAENCLLDYAKLIANQILSNDIDLIKGSNEIYKAYLHLDYAPELANWDYLHGGMHPENYEDLVFNTNGIEDKHLLEEAIKEEAAKMIYGKKTTVHQIKVKPDFEFAEEKEAGFLSRLWKRIF